MELLEVTILTYNIFLMVMALWSVYQLYRMSPAWRSAWVCLALGILLAPVSRLYGLVSGALCPDNTSEYTFVVTFPLVGNTFYAIGLFTLYKLFHKYLKPNGIHKEELKN